jgi:hypothetical protein
MRKMAELYGAWLLGVLTTCGLAYWFYRQSGSPGYVRAEDISTDDTDETVRRETVGKPVNQIRQRFFE